MWPSSQPAQGSFTINRLSANYGQYTLNAIRGFASAAVVNVTASAGTGAHNVQWRMNPADQPSDALPAGISLDMGNPVDIAADTSVPTQIKLTGNASAGASGTVILKLYAQESGDRWWIQKRSAAPANTVKQKKPPTPGQSQGVGGIHPITRQGPGFLAQPSSINTRTTSTANLRPSRLRSCQEGVVERAVSDDRASGPATGSNRVP